MTTEPPPPSGPEAEWTCGKGLAAHARIPAGMAELLGSLAENLEAHVPTIDTADDAGRAEREAYVGLSTEFAELAAGLARTAEKMREYEDLPPAGHHDEALADPRLVEKYERLLTLKRELAELLAGSVEQEEGAQEEGTREGPPS